MELSSEDLAMLDPKELLLGGLSLADLAALRRAGRLPPPAAPAPVTTPAEGRWQVPSKLPTFNPDKGSANPRAHLQKIDTISGCHRIPEDARRLILTASLRGTAIEWAAEALHADLSWQETQSSFLSTYLTQDAEIADLQQLDTLRQNATLVRDYGLKFLTLARRLDIPLTDRRLMLRFQRGLRADIQTSFAAMAKSAPPADLSAAIQYAREVELSIRPINPEPLSSSSADSTKRGRPGPACPLPGHHRHLESECRTKKPRGHGGAPTSSSSDFPFHPMPLSSSPSSSSSSMSSATPPPHRDLSHITCHRCRQKGHYANKCPNPSAKSVHVGRQANPNPDGTVYSPHTVYGWRDIEARLLELDSEVSDDALLVSMVLGHDGVKLTAVAEIDTGASHGFLSQDFVTKAGIEILPASGNITLAAAQTVSRIGKTIPLEVSYGSRRERYSFEVMPLPSGIEMLVGRDLIRLLGIGISGLLTPMTEYPEPVPEMSAPTTSEGNAPHLDHQALEEAIQDAISQNLSLGPGFCTLESSLVYIPVPSGQFSYVRQYKVPYVWREYVTHTIEQWFKDGVIELATPGCPGNNSLLCAAKRESDGTISTTRCRVCIDIRGVNKLLPAMDNFPLPVIKDIFECLSGAEVYSVIDLDAAYNRLLVNPTDRHHVAFTWNNTQYWFKGAPFGLSFLPSHFCRLMSVVLSEYNSFCKVYMDDIIVYSSSMEAHIVHVRTILERLTQVNLRINSKSHFGLSSVFLLGHVISSQGLHIDYRKLKGIDSWEQPTSARQVQHYMGVFNYFREFIPKFSHIAAPLDRVRHDFQWGAPQQTAWETLTKLLESAPILHFPDFNQKFFLATDASTFGIAAVLFQKDSSGKAKYISFKARALKGAERNYSATKLECLAMVYGCLQFRHYVFGRRFTLITDHQALCYLYNRKEPNRISTGWFETLLEFDFDVTHIPGIHNVLPDNLSRIFSPGRSVDRPTLTEVRCNAVTIEGQTIVAPHPSEQQGQTVIAPEASSSTPSGQTKIVPMQTKTITAHDDSLGGLITLQDDNEYEKVDSQQERIELLEKYHSFGHFGSQALLRALTRGGYRWENMHKDAAKFVKGCIPCARHNIKKRGFHPVTPSFALLPFDHLAVDTISPSCLSTNGYLYILIIVDLATRFVILKPLKTKLMIEIASVFFEIMGVFGIPRIIQSDNGSEFANQLIAELQKVAGFEHRFTTPYHPMANGVVERHVGTAMTTLRKHLNGNERDWDLYLSLTQLEVNNHEHSLTGSSPFSLLFGRALDPFRKCNEESRLVTPEELVEKFKLMHKLVYPAVADRVHEQQARTALELDGKRDIAEFPIGSFVMVKDIFRKGKLSPRYEGPYKVVRKTKGGTYSLLDHDNSLLPRNFAPSQITMVAPRERSDETSYVVESILKHRGRQGAYQYLVKWRGFSAAENSWVPENNFDDIEVIATYWRAQAQAKRTPVQPRRTPRRR